MNIILISGKSKAGKDEVADSIHYHGLVTNCRITRFAESLKSKTSEFFNQNINWDNVKEKDFYREFLIVAGQKAREIDPDFWAKLTCNRILDLKCINCNWIIIPDTRFSNEIYFIQKAFPDDNIVTLRVEASSETRVLRGADPSYFFDPTEVNLDNYNFDYTIYNNNSLSILDQEVTKFIKYINA